jgi:hypothetical protein
VRTWFNSRQTNDMNFQTLPRRKVNQVSRKISLNRLCGHA